MKSISIKAAAIGAASLVLLTGCQSVSDQIGKKMAEGIVNQATNGQVKIDDKGNGNMTIKTKDGEANIGGGSQRPDSAPADMPSLAGAKDFGWFGSKDQGILTFTVDSGSYKDVWKQMDGQLTASGWAVDDSGFNMEVESSKTTMYKKTGFMLSLTCATDDAGKVTSVTMSKSANTAAPEPTPAPTPAPDMGASE